MSEPATASACDIIEIADMSDDGLGALNRERRLSLSISDLAEIRAHYRLIGRNPTCVEIEAIAQTWSEHCKHRIFNARIEHRDADGVTMVAGIFDTFIRAVTEKVRRVKPDFVLGAFDDNAGFINLDGRTAACLKVETHNHPSAIEPYGGAGTGLGGVIRDILGAGKGARPVASLDVFCVGMPDAPPESIPGDRIHPLGILRGVVRGVRDYGNRMGIPTVAGAILFDPGYVFNPLVFCGTAGILPAADIGKQVTPGLKIVLIGGRTGRDGIRGATFSSASLTSESGSTDRSAVQIANPIEEKKVLDVVLKARSAGLIEFITDCGAGGLSSAVGEMVRHTGGRIHLDRVPLKDDTLASWEIFLSESQERMVMAVREENMDALRAIAGTFDAECSIIGEVDESGALEVRHHDVTVAHLDCAFLHAAPAKTLVSRTRTRPDFFALLAPPAEPADALRTILSNINVASREPVIRQYDHEVQGNTVVKPLGGPGGDNPADGVAIRVDGTGKFIALGVGISPWVGVIDPYRMGLTCVDEAVRQVTVAGANPDRIALLDNFCAGNPEDPEELGALVECAKGMSAAADAFAAPFISGKDSFNNHYRSASCGSVSIPLTLAVSSIGVVEERMHLISTSFCRPSSLVCMAGITRNELGGGIRYRLLQDPGGAAPGLDAEQALRLYRAYYRCVRDGWIRSAHDLSDGGLAVAVSEMAFSFGGGVEIDLQNVAADAGMCAADILFSESNARILFEIDINRLNAVSRHFAGLPFSIIGRTVGHHSNFLARMAKETLLNEPLKELKSLWKTALKPYF